MPIFFASIIKKLKINIIKRIIISEIVIIFVLMIYIAFTNIGKTKDNKALTTTTTINTAQLPILPPNATVISPAAGIKTYLNTKYNFSFKYFDTLDLKEWAKTPGATNTNDLRIFLSKDDTPESSVTPPAKADDLIATDKINIYVDKQDPKIKKSFLNLVSGKKWEKLNFNGFDIWKKETNLFDLYLSQKLIKTKTKEEKARAEIYKTQNVLLYYFEHGNYFYTIKVMVASGKETQTIISSWIFSK